MGHVTAIEGNVVTVDFGGPGPLLSKKQLAAHPAIRKSTRWVEIQMRAGLPSQLDGNRRKFSLSEVQSWLESHGKKAAHG